MSVSRIDKENYMKLSFLIVSVFVVLYILFVVPGLFLPLLLSAIIAYLLYPLVNYMEQKNITRWISISLLYIVIGFIFFLLYKYSMGKILEQFKTMQTDIPKIFSSVMSRLKYFEEEYLSKYVFLERIDLIGRLKTFILDTTQSIFISVPKILSSLVSTLLLVPFYAFFLLKDGGELKRWFFKQLPNKFFESGAKLIYDVNKEMGGFIRARLLEAIIVGLIVGIGLSILQLKYFIFLSLFVAAMNLIPYLGPFIGALPGLIIAFYYYGFDSRFVVVLLIYIFAQIIDIFFIIPFVFAKIVKVHPVVVVVLIFIGSSAYGIVGMILAVPVFSILKSVYNVVFQRVVGNNILD